MYLIDHVAAVRDLPISLVKNQETDRALSRASDPINGAAISCAIHRKIDLANSCAR